MLSCRICGKKFKTKAALGGHMSNAHPNQAASTTPCEIKAPGTQASQPVASPQITQETEAKEIKEQIALLEGSVEKQELQVVEDDEGVAAEVRGYISRGYNFEQLTKKLGFAPRTVRREMEKFVPPEDAELGEGGDGLPVTRKMGGGAEIINPEAVLRSYMDGSDSEKIELRGMMKLRAAMLMVMDLVNIRKADSEAYALMVKPILDMMKETRAEQDAAAERAKASNVEIADRAAQQTAVQMANFLDSKIANIPKPQESKSIADRVLGPAADMMGQMMGNLFKSFIPGGQGAQGGQPSMADGWEYKKETEK